jgi:flagellar motility protein MotE (MotC chaperone)
MRSSDQGRAARPRRFGERLAARARRADRTLRLQGLAALLGAGMLAKIAVPGGAWLVALEAASVEPAHAAAPEAAPGDACAAEGRGLRELAEAVRARAQELERRQAELDAREAGLAAVRRTLSAELDRLEALAKSLGLVGSTAPTVSITKVYQSMRAGDAAAILERLDDASLRAVLGRLPERQVAAILAAMTPERAVAFTKAFARPASP